MTTLTEGRYAAEFVMTEGNGNISRDVVTIVSGAGVIEPGTVLGKITASGKYTTSLLAAVDGSQNPVAVALYGCDATSADQQITAITRNAEVNGNMLVFGADINTDPEKAAAKAALTALGIVVR